MSQVAVLIVQPGIFCQDSTWIQAFREWEVRARLHHGAGLLIPNTEGASSDRAEGLLLEPGATGTSRAVLSDDFS